jgi:hypothetical protein
MICRTRRFVCDPIIASTRFSGTSRAGGLRFRIALAFALLTAPLLRAEPVDPEVGRILERALQEAENFRKQLPTLEYDASMRVQEWDGHGRLRGTAKATAIMRPGDAKPITFLSREVQGKVRFPDDKDKGKDDDEPDVTLQQFAAEHRIAERFEFITNGPAEVAGERARRVDFKPRPNQPEKNTADRFLDTISGTAWVSESNNKLVKFELRLMRPFQLFWIFAVLKDLSIQYELLEPDEILGHAKLKVLFALTTPVYSIRQLHEVEMDHFRRRNKLAQR